MKVLFDGDLLCYQASSAVQKDIDWGDGLYTCHAYLGDAQDTLVTTLNTIIKDLGLKEGDDVDYYFMFSDRDSNFRKVLNPFYKSNRRNHRKPTCYWALVDALDEVCEDVSAEFVKAPSLEGDDLLGIYSTRYMDDSIIVSMDKDFKTLPVKFYDYNKKEFIDNRRNYKQAFYNTCLQTLTGDATDGYKGCKGVGKVKAKSILDKVLKEDKDLWVATTDTFLKAGMTHEDAINEFRMAHILWDGDYDFKSNKLIFKSPMEYML